jgi:thioester reductase-like protein
MSVFITGVTGYVGKHLLHYMLTLTHRQIVVCIRDKGITAKERFKKEILEHGLFTNLDTSRISLIEKDVSNLEASDIENCTHVIHCAANVKFNSPFDLLMKENVDALKKFYSICKEKRFYHISTCYVHPTTTSGPYQSIKIQSGLKKTDFICNYAYTKYLAEQFLYKKKNVDIIRLSCVGSPIEKLTPMRGGAHLAILELLERSKLPDIWIPENLRFSVVPVDIVCRGIISRLNTSSEEVSIIQYSAPEESETYNVNVKNILKNRTFSAKIWNTSYDEFLDWMKFFYYFFPLILKRIIDANDVISYVKLNQSFHSDIDVPSLTPKEYTDMTIDYVHRLVGSNNFIYEKFLYLWKILKEILVWALG